MTCTRERRYYLCFSYNARPLTSAVAFILYLFNRSSSLPPPSPLWIHHIFLNFRPRGREMINRPSISLRFSSPVRECGFYFIFIFSIIILIPEYATQYFVCETSEKVVDTIVKLVSLYFSLNSLQLNWDDLARHVQR